MKNTPVSEYLSLIKFSHTIFAMPFALIGFFLATGFYGYPFSWLTLFLVILCMVFARSAAMAFNRYLDRKIDYKNPRTRNREIPGGRVKPGSALVFTILSSLAFIVCTWFINSLVFALSPIALLVVLGYSYTKRFTYLCHVILGVGLALAPIGAWLAVTGSFHLIPVLLSFAVLAWVAGFDVIYALQDEEFDKENQLYSIPSSFGKKKALTISSVLHVFSALLVVLTGYLGGLGLLYWIGSGLFAGLLMYQHSLVKPNDLSKVNLAFFSTNGIASFVFAIFVIADIYLAFGDSVCFRP